MPEFDDVMQPPHYRSQLEYNPVSEIDRYTVLLKDGETTATIYPIHSANELPPGLLAFLCDEFNMEIERGDTNSFFDTLHIEQFQNYWFGSFAAVMVLGDSHTLEGARQWEKECFGTFFIKPNYPGRSSHICTANFLVNAGIRGKGIGRTLTDCYLEWAPRLGYTYSIFNLVFETNVAARRIWESLNFKRLGRIKAAGILKGHDKAVDAIMYGRELVNTSDPALGAYRFDKIRFYLQTGRYPAMADRQEKSRLRSSASHYSLENGKLMLKGREVVSDPVRQVEICTEVHMANHAGINKTTSIVTEKYHWTRIKDTVAQVVKNCTDCKDQSRDVAPVKRHPHSKKHTADSQKGAYQSNGLRTRDDVDAIVAAAQLHNIPSHRHDPELLTHDLAGLDAGLIAVVEQAQEQHQRIQRQQQQQQLQQLHHQQHNLQLHHQSYAAAAASAVSGDNQYQSYQSDYDYSEVAGPTKRRESTDVVDPEVSGYAHNSGGDEIEIARALIQANEDQEPGEMHDDALNDDSQTRRHEETQGRGRGRLQKENGESYITDSD